MAFFHLSITQSFLVVGIVGKPVPLLRAVVFPHFNNLCTILAPAPMCDTKVESVHLHLYDVKYGKEGHLLKKCGSRMLPSNSTAVVVWSLCSFVSEH
jgi:hypothetical protein